MLLRSVLDEPAALDARPVTVPELVAQQGHQLRRFGCSDAQFDEFLKRPISRGTDAAGSAVTT